MGMRTNIIVASMRQHLLRSDQFICLPDNPPETDCLQCGKKHRDYSFPSFFDGSSALRARQPQHVKTWLEEHNIPSRSCAPELVEALQAYHRGDIKDRDVEAALSRK